MPLSRLSHLAAVLLSPLRSPAGHSGHAGAGHDARSPTLTIRSGPPRVGVPTALSLEVRDPEGRPVRDARVSHERKFHVFVLSRDLEFFAHEHGEPDGDRLRAGPVTFARPGAHRIFVQFVDAQGTERLVSAALEVDGAGGPARPLDARPLPAVVRVDERDVELDRRGERLVFRIRRGGREATLSPVLGALGHVVVVREGAEQLVHVHPVGGDAARGTAEFVAHLPGAGMYKVFGEFEADGARIVAPFAIAGS